MIRINTEIKIHLMSHVIGGLSRRRDQILISLLKFLLFSCLNLR